MSTLVFLHGLNTFGDDDLHLGPLRFGLMHRHLESAFRERGVPFIPVTGIGAGSPEVLAERALAFLEKNAVLEREGAIDLLGQSVGGIVARALAARSELKGRVRLVMTLGTPHLGSTAAETGVEFEHRHPVLDRAARLFGYDTRAKRDVFRHYTPAALAEFNVRFPATAREIALLCEVEPRDLTLPIRALFERLQRKTADGKRLAGDGFIPTGSQRRQENLGPFALDHLSALGYFFFSRPSARRRAEQEFARLVATVAELVTKG